MFSFLNNAAAKRKERRPSHGRGKAAVTFAAQLTLVGVSREFDGKLALDNVSLDVAPGEIVCLVGPSGCGKTTLLRIASGVERPSAGRVLIDGQEVAGPNRFVPPEKRGVGLMFQDFALFPHLSILDNVAFGLKSLTRSEAKREALAALDRVGLAHYANEYPHILSGGEQQRVALARAIAPRPGVLLMDEPFSGLDPRLREKIREETLAILNETRATSIVVTHDAEEAMRMGDRVALMREGRIAQIGTALDLYRNPKDILTARAFSDLNEVPAVHQKRQCRHRARQFRRHKASPKARPRSLACGSVASACCLRARASRRGRCISASSATMRWSSWRCRGWTRRSWRGCAKATRRLPAPSLASASMRAQCSSLRRSKARLLEYPLCCHSADESRLGDEAWA